MPCQLYLLLGKKSTFSILWHHDFISHFRVIHKYIEIWGGVGLWCWHEGSWKGGVLKEDDNGEYIHKWLYPNISLYTVYQTSWIHTACCMFHGCNVVPLAYQICHSKSPDAHKILCSLLHLHSNSPTSNSHSKYNAYLLLLEFRDMHSCKCHFEHNLAIS